VESRDKIAIAECPLFSGINQEEMEDLLKWISPGVETYDIGSLLRFQGDEYNSLLILLEGEVSAEIQDYSGRTVKIENLKAPDAIASGILFAEDNTLPVTLVAQKPIRLISLKREDILSLAQKNRTFLQNYFSDSGNKVAFLAEKIRLFKFNTLREKFAGYLLNLSGKQNSDRVKLPYSREKLAELFGVARPSLSRTCSELADEGLVDLHGKTVTILDKKGLKAIINPL